MAVAVVVEVQLLVHQAALVAAARVDPTAPVLLEQRILAAVAAVQPLTRAAAVPVLSFSSSDNTCHA